MKRSVFALCAALSLGGAVLGCAHKPAPEAAKPTEAAKPADSATPAPAAEPAKPAEPENRPPPAQ